MTAPHFIRIIWIKCDNMLIGMLIANRGVFSDSGGMAAVMESPWRFLGSWAGAGLIELTPERETLEDVFRQLVTEEENAA